VNESRRPDGRAAPLDVAALADLDAGLPDEARAARARAEAAADPAAAAVLDALAATRAELAALPTPEVPAAAEARWRAALAAEAAAAQARTGETRTGETPATACHARPRASCARDRKRGPCCRRACDRSRNERSVAALAGDRR